MRSEWLLPCSDRTTVKTHLRIPAREARKNLLLQLQNPTVQFAQSLLKILESIALKKLEETMRRILVSHRASQQEYVRHATVEELSRKMAMHQKDANRVFSELLLPQDLRQRKKRPSKKPTLLAIGNIERCKNYLYEASRLQTQGSVAAKTRRKYGVSLVTLYRVSLAGFECSDTPFAIEYKRDFEKMGAHAVGFQFCIVPSWVKETQLLSAESESLTCGARCMKHPETREMQEAYEALAAPHI